MSMFEVLLPLAMTLVEDGLLDLPTLLSRLSAGPADALRLPAGKLAVGSAADLVLAYQEIPDNKQVTIVDSRP